MANRLEAQITRVSALELAQTLKLAWQAELGSTPSRQALAVLLAQSALETGHWKQCYCYNLGNAKASNSWSGDYCFYAADEIVSEAQAAQAYAQRAPRTDGAAGHNVALTKLKSGKVQVTLRPDHPWCRFRAFTSLQEGTRDYLLLLNRRFKAAWPAVEAGDPERFVRTLHELHYFTASIERYLPPVLQLFTKFDKLLQANAPGPETTPSALALPVSAEGKPTLRRGTQGSDVRELQRILKEQGYEDVPQNGVFDELTLHAVELFQLQHIDERGRPLGSDGIVGKNTWWALLNPSGDAQRNGLSAPPAAGLTAARAQLLAVLHTEHSKPVFETPDGSNRSPDIDRYWGKTGVLGKAWCCAFVSWALKETLARLPIGGKHHLGVQVMWVAARELGMATTAPKPGDLFIQLKSRGTGHTGFVVGVSTDGKTIYTCEGNCGNRVKYGQRPADSIHHYIDCIQDGQGLDFPRGADLQFDVVGDDDTR